MRKYLFFASSTLTGEYLGSVTCHSLNFDKASSEPLVSEFVQRLFSEHEDYPVFQCYITTVRQQWIKKYVLLSKVGYSVFDLDLGSYLSVERVDKFLILKEVKP